ncbi:HlyD family efflux transporter periplasmic adaptor subunit [uncultured Paraglaciecola sp.]|uniref:HlyD family efflux transporter periplasmic adaptor subunit n=1 Tax=uncultured Paraglaciecola sp. TaxID=1765024 RepID=UPI00262E55FF|nr:HlyD family efflux transporter periplasmic adaptor subunit [uncultured Paraglaciecola sp.]
MKYNSVQEDKVTLTRSRSIIYVTFLLIVVFFVWAALSPLVEVSTGIGKVISSSKDQVIQSLEGGILSELLVKEGDIVEAGQVLARLDPTQTESGVEESASQYRAALARSTRLQAELDEKRLRFPSSLDGYSELIQEEKRLYNSRKKRMRDTLTSIDSAIELLSRELNISRDLLQSGAASQVEVIRLERQKSDLELKRIDSLSQYIVQAREELAKANAQVESLTSVLKGRTDSLQRLTLRSPMRGVVKDIYVSTLGGVVARNGELMQIVPLDDKLLVEAQVSPRDIAFIRPGLEASVKITAYDYSIYGGLDGKIVTISPDTIRDEVKADVFYYRVNILTDKYYLENKSGVKFPIVPGMIASVDIITGEKTVLDYLLKPLNRAKEALRER